MQIRIPARNEFGTWRHGVLSRARILLGLIGMMWVIEFIDWVLLGGSLNQVGIHPRDFGTMWQIAVAPFLHNGPGHLLANTGPILWMGALISVWGAAELILVTGSVAIFGGLGTWVIGRTGVHQGASLLAFGYLGYLVARGVTERRLLAITVAIVTAAWYGSMIFGILPGQGMISWESHVSGLLTGAVIGYLRSRGNRAVIARG